jgi:hypothetical protein
MSNKHFQRNTPIVAERIRQIGKDGFAFIPNLFLQRGFFAALQAVLAGNRRGLSFYHYDTLCDLLRWPVERYVSARNGLIDRDLIAFDGTRFQVLELPLDPPAPRAALTDEASMEQHDPATIQTLIRSSLAFDE